MPGAAPTLGSYKYVEETKENLDWADLPTIDLALFATEEGKQELTKILTEAFTKYGFFYVKNFGISQERVDRQFSIGNQFYELPLEEKLKYKPDHSQGHYNGYSPAGRHEIVPGLFSRTEVYNIPKFTPHFQQDHPELIKTVLPEIESFARDLHTHVLDPLHILFARALELPEDYFTKIHRYEEKSEDHLRYMKYSKFTPEENARIKDGWARGHTDLGTITLLFRQPVAALQIKQPFDDQWKWVKPQDGTLTVNTCDALSFLTGGYVKSTIHKVNVPPKDQQHVDRLGLLYFARPENTVVLRAIKESPVLQRLGLTENELEKAAKETGAPLPNMEDWTFKKQKWQQAGGYQRDRHAVIVPGHQEKTYD
ncbi:flavonol synthase [Atractiella rhizophila]|nr:flavonol synthase [Atractiella rhizophila]